jgi:hypothetical protein
MDGGRLAIEGNATQRSYLPGEQVTLCLAAQSRSRSVVTIERLGATTQPVWSAPVWGYPKPIPVDASEHGCGWDSVEDGNLTFEVQDEWPTGFYRIVMSAPAGASRLRPGEAFFVVRSPHPGRDSKILVILSSNTYMPITTTARVASQRPTAPTAASMIKPGRPRFIGRCLSGFSHRMIVSPDSRQQRYAGWDKWEWPFV